MAELWIAFREAKAQLLDNAGYLYGCECRIILMRRQSLLSAHRAFLVPINQSMNLKPPATTVNPSNSKTEELVFEKHISQPNEHILASGPWSCSRLDAVKNLLSELEIATTNALAGC